MASNQWLADLWRKHMPSDVHEFELQHSAFRAGIEQMVHDAIDAAMKEASPNPRSVSWELRGEVRCRNGRMFVYHSNRAADSASDNVLDAEQIGETGTLRCTFTPDTPDAEGE